MNPAERPASPVFVDQLRVDARRIAEVLGSARHDVPVAACPEWTVGDLVEHLGGVHRWARHAVLEAQRPSGSVTDTPGTDLGAWLVEGADALADTLAALPDDAPSWNPFGAPPVVAFWPRRQAHETMVHRWDVEAAAGVTTAFPPVLASDGIDEFFEVIVPRNVARDTAVLPTESLHVHCTDVAGEWLLWIEDGTLRMRREHAKGAAALRGPAESLLLLLWGRTHVLDETIDVVGDIDVAAQWSRLAG